MIFLSLVGLLIPYYTLTVSSISYQLDEDSEEKFVFLFAESFILNEEVFDELEKYDLIKLYEITPTTYIFLHNGNGRPDESISKAKKKFKEQIVEIENVKRYVQFYHTEEPTVNLKTFRSQTLGKPNLVCDKYWGMGIEDAWSRGYSGNGIVVAVTDVGVNTDLIDLQQNIDQDQSFNFVDNKRDVTPEEFPSYRELSFTDHGNRCASVIAAVKGNEFCSAGIAFNATIVALKIFKVTKTNHNFALKTSSDSMARYPETKRQYVDIFSNSWGPDQPFMTINIDQKEALKLSSNKGRKGLGALQIFPVSAVGNELANNENTITVSAVGPHGKTPSDSTISASVITAGLRNGNNLTAGSMVTTSRGNKCISSFAGVSAATAQVAGILALALEANPSLTFDDVQDLIVHSSEVGCLADPEKITINAAGLKFHPVFGFGILNASKLVTNAEEALEGLKFLPQTVNEMSSCSSDEEEEYTAEFCYSCSGNDDCFDVIKTAKLQIKYTTTAHQMRITLVSPNGTTSVLQDYTSEQLKTESQTGRVQVLTSVHFWDEPAFGLWTLRLHYDGKLNMSGQVSLTLFGAVLNLKANTFTPTANGTECASKCRSHTFTPEANSTECASECRSHDNTTTPSIQIILLAVFVTICILLVVGIAVYCIYIKRNREPSTYNPVNRSEIELENR